MNNRILYLYGIFLWVCLLCFSAQSNAQNNQLVCKLPTPWTDKINPGLPLPEYPRPLLERKDWLNLNGTWEYAIRDKDSIQPASFDGKILAPFAVESFLSGVQKTVNEKQELWYKRTFSIPALWKGKHIRLNFGAVDWRADVFVNDIFIGSHQGGYTPFSFDITPFLLAKGEEKLVVRVWDPTDKGFQPLGKQFQEPTGILYTSVTGIWQTVWLEPVSDNYVTDVCNIPDIDREKLDITVRTANEHNNDVIEVKVLDKGKLIGTTKGLANMNLQIPVENPKLWSPESPYLYEVEINVFRSGKIVDKVSSYTAMRKISTARDANGVLRLQLNNKDCFQYGILDQGYWPDGLYTAPTDEALLFDIIKAKELGYNMIRKHAKVEPARWYYHCDREGILVWQDMPGGEIGGNDFSQKEFNGGSDKIRTTESKENYYQEWKEIINCCISNPSVVVWVPFNEGWGQFETEKVVEFTKRHDPSRLVDPASGGNHRPCGDIIDLHNYPEPSLFLYESQRATVLGEYGGIGWPMDGHLWVDKSWGYVQFKSKEDVTVQYVKYAKDLQNLVKYGFSAAVYTQLTDIESEVNGLITYDRKEIKVNTDEIRKANQSVINELMKNKKSE
ncbi:MAG: beta-galactosidase [Tannerella sp.]|jgi:beta-galactosidase/beta-glucuronidase|nr:beta-galactosidase [Tannerella sp.]